MGCVRTAMTPKNKKRPLVRPLLHEVACEGEVTDRYFFFAAFFFFVAFLAAFFLAIVVLLTERVVA